MPDDVETRASGEVGAPEPPGELKQITILFADLAGSTKLCEGLGPEQVHDLIDAWVKVITAEIYRFGGIVTEFAGDAVMALFGAPVAYEDSPQRACRAALAMQQAVARLNAERNTPLQMRVGIDTGESFIGAVGNEQRSEYTALGHRANLAKRVQEVAEKGSVTVSDATYPLIAPHFQTVEAGEFPAKGLSRPLRVYRVLHEGPARARLDVTLERWQPQLIGRDEPLAELRRQLDGLTRSQRQLVGLEGEAGIGKSRLALELKKMARAASVEVWEGRAQPHGEKQAYAIYADVIRRIGGIEDTDTAAAVREKLRRITGIEEADIPFIEALFSVDVPDGPLRELEPEARKTSIFGALAALLRRRASSGPLLLLLDDFHWADRLSHQLTEHALRGMDDLPFMLCLVSRPEGVDLPSRSSFSIISLDVLSAAQTSDLILSLLNLSRGEAELAFCAGVHRISGGNPLFVEEVIQSLIVRGLVTSTELGWRVAGDIRDIQIPGSVQDLIASRVDRLPEVEKSVLQTAAVIGEEFELDLLHELSGRPKIEQVLTELVRYGFLIEDVERTHLAFQFKHGLTWQVAYRTVPRSRRAPIHERVAEILERTYTDHLEPHYERLAHHYAASANDARALLYLRRSAEKASRAFANEDAVAHYGEALERARTLADPAAEIDILLGRGEIRSRALGEYAAAIEDFDAAAEIAHAQRRSQAEALACLRKGEAFSHQYRFDDAVPWFDRALAVTREEACPETVQALVLKGYAFAEGGGADADAALGCIDRALAMSREMGDPHLEIQSLIQLGTLQQNLRRFDEARESFERCLTLCEEAGDRVSLSLALQNLSRVCIWTMDLDRAIQLIDRLQEVLAKTGDRRRLANSYYILGGAWLGKGDPQKTLECFEESLCRFRELGVNIQTKMALRMLRTLHAQAGHAEREIVLLEELVSLMREDESNADVADALSQLGQAYRQIGNVEHAEQPLAEAAKMFIDAHDYDRAMSCVESLRSQPEKVD